MVPNKIFTTPSVPSSYLNSLFAESALPVLKFNQELDVLSYNSAALDFFQEFRNILNPTQENNAKPLIDIKSLLSIDLPTNTIQEIRDTCEKILKLNQELSPSAFIPIKINISYHYMSQKNLKIPMQINLLPPPTPSTLEFLVIISCSFDIIKVSLQLDQKSAELSSIYQAAPLGIGVVENRIFTSLNPYFCNLLGYTEEELINQDAKVVYPSQEEYERVGRVKHPQIVEHGVGSIETQLITKQGELVEIFLSSAARRDRDLSTGVVFTALDISARKKANRALRESRQMFKTVLDTIPIRITWKNTECEFLGCNQAFASDIGLDNPEDIVGKTVFDFFPENLANKYHSDDQNIIQTKKSKLNYVEPQINSKGEFRWFRSTKIPLYNSEGELMGLLGVFEDITDIHEVENKMAKIQEQLIQTQKMEAIGRLAGGVAHEFNNILTAILGYVDVFKAKYTDPESLPQQAAAQITQNIERGSKLIKQLLGFARSGNWDPQPLDINKEIIKISEMTQSLFSKSIEVKLNLFSEPLIVNVDQSQFELSITNLLINARDALDDGGTIYIETFLITPESANWDEVSAFHNKSPSININTYIPSHPPSKTLSTSQSHPQFIQIKIRDTGIGMTESVKKHIFEPFFTTKDKDKGTGLGLSMVYGFITKHYGFIKVDSSPNEGATFTIYLPRSVDAEEKIQKSDNVTSFSGEGTILVVDDEESIRKSLSLQLNHLGYQVITASNGEEAINTYKNNKSKINVVLLDLVMPVMDGRTCFARLRELDPLVKIIIITGYSHTEQVKNMIKLGVDGFLEKPLNLSELTNALSNIHDSTT